MLVSDYILDFLQKKGVKKVFLITGGAIAFVVDAFSRNKNINIEFYLSSLCQRMVEGFIKKKIKVC